MATIKWAKGVGGTWTTAADWAGGVVPGASDTAVIDAAGRYNIIIDTPVTVGGLILDTPGAELVDQDSLTCGDLQLEHGRIDLDGGSLSGTLMASAAGKRDGEFHVTGTGTLVGLTIEGSLYVPATAHDKGTLVIASGVDLVGPNGTGAGSMALNCSLELDGVSNLDNAAISFGFVDRAAISLTIAGAPTLTLGSGLALTYANVQVAHATQTITNDGTASGCTFDAGKGGTLSLTNNGTFVGVTSNAVVINDGIVVGGVYTGLFTNDAVAESGSNGGTLELTYGDVAAPGVGASIVIEDGGILGLAGSYTTAQLGAFYTAQNVIIDGNVGLGVDGTLNNHGATLTIGKHSGYGILECQGGGVINGGKIIDRGGEDATSYNLGNVALQGVDYVSQQSTLALGAVNATDILLTGATTLEMDNGGTFTGGTLSGVGTLDLGADLRGPVILNGVDITGIGGNGAVTANLYDDGTMEIAAGQSVAGYTINNSAGGQTILGSGAVVAGAVINLDAGILLYGDTGGSATATLASSTQVNVTTASSWLMDNYGATSALVSAAAFDISSGATLVLLTNAGAFTNENIITVASGGNLTVNSQALFTNTGTVAVSSGATLEITQQLLQDNGVFSLSSGSTLDLENSLTASQLISLAASAPGVAFQISETLDLGNSTITMGKNGVPDFSVTGMYADNAYTGIVQNGTLVVPSGTVMGIQDGAITASLVNDGIINIGPGSAQFDAISGSGTINLDASNTIDGTTFNGSVGVGQLINFDVQGQTMSFLNGSGNQFAGTIGGFTVGDTIALYGDTVTSAAFSGHSIVATLISGATIELQTASALSGSLSVFGGAEIVYESEQAPARQSMAGHVPHDIGSLSTAADSSVLQSEYWGGGAFAFLSHTTHFRG